MEISPKKGADRNKCSYEEFIAPRPPNLSGDPMPVIIMEWIREMEMEFESCDCSNKRKTVLAVRRLKTEVLSWWKRMASTMPKGEVGRMSWEVFLVHLKREYIQDRYLLEISMNSRTWRKERSMSPSSMQPFWKRWS